LTPRFLRWFASERQLLSIANRDLDFFDWSWSPRWRSTCLFSSFEFCWTKLQEQRKDWHERIPFRRGRREGHVLQDNILQVIHVDPFSFGHSSEFSDLTDTQREFVKRERELGMTPKVVNCNDASL
jgi:hypothetical protein